MGRKVKLGRSPAHRRDMLRTLVTQLLQHERIHTTLARAKALRSLADKMITCGKEGTREAKSRAGAVVRTEREVHKLFTVFAERYRERQGGYTRVLRTGLRQHDTAPMAYIELVDRQGELRPARPLPSYSHLPAAAQLALHRALPQFPPPRPASSGARRLAGGTTSSSSDAGSSDASASSSGGSTPMEVDPREEAFRPAPGALPLGQRC